MGLSEEMVLLEQMLRLTPQEQAIVNYHRSNMQAPGVDELGRPVTVFSTGLTVRDGPHKGKFVSVPGFVNGQVVTDEDALYQLWKPQIDAGNWPLYDSGEALNQRSQAIHKIMDLEVMKPTMGRVNGAIPARNAADLPPLRTPSHGVRG